MTKREYLYVVAMEECAELTKALSKCCRFGGNLCGVDGYCNEDNTIYEYCDLMATIEMLYAAGGLPHYDKEEIEQLKADKKEKVEKYWNERNERNDLPRQG